MPRKRKNELVAGLFVIVCVALGMGLVVWLGGADWFRPQAQIAYFWADLSRGAHQLEVGGQVKAGDVVVGKIISIELDLATKKVLYAVKIQREDMEIHEDGKAMVSAALVGGANLVILDKGTPGENLADRDNPVEIAKGVIETVSAAFDRQKKDSVIAKVHRILEDLQRGLASAKESLAIVRLQMNAEDKEAMLHRLLETIKHIQAIAADAKPKLAETLGDARKVAAKIKELTDRDVVDILAKLREANTKILKMTENFRAVSEEAKQIVTVNRSSIDEMIDNMTVLSATLKATSTELRRNPWRLLYKPDEKELASQNLFDAARAFSAGATELDQALTKLKAVDPKVASGEAVKAVHDHLKRTFTRFKNAEDALWKEFRK